MMLDDSFHYPDENDFYGDFYDERDMFDELYPAENLVWEDSGN